jgi:hypothetical protein
VFRAQADWTFILPSELPTKELRQLLRKMPSQGYQTSQYVVPRGGIFLGMWRSSIVVCSDGKMNVQSAFDLNTGIKTNCLMQFRETTAVYSENHMEHTYTRTLCGQNAELFTAEAGGTYTVVIIML